MGEVCQVYCRSGTCDLDAVGRALAEYGLTVTHQSDHLTAGWPGGPHFRIWLEVGEPVRAEAAEIGEGTPHEAAMRECDARFDIGIDDLDEALQEINTLIEVQTAVQDASQGYLFLPWNNNLSEPWRE
jgi:hypothetical protein